MRNNRTVLLAGLCLACCAVLANEGEAKAPPPAPSTAVAVSGGTIAGLRLEGDVRAYKGIPYAAPPVGPLRWKPPQPVVPWQGTRACVEFGAICYQVPTPSNPVINRMSEDCLTLNVWTAAGKDEKRPVAIWIHGGGLTRKSGDMPVADGAALARRGMVVVTFNFRLGAFGFFAHPLLSKESEQGVSGNYGMLDQLACFRWVQQNIAAFGGDPAQVVIFGTSAGGGSVGMHMTSPLAKGLFTRALLESGSPRGRLHLKEAWYGKEPLEQTGARFARQWGCEPQPDALQALRALSPEKLMEAPEGTFFVAIDGWYLPDDPCELWAAGKMHPVPFMTGSTSDEGSSRAPREFKDDAAYAAWVRKEYGEHAPLVLKELPFGADGAAAKAAKVISNLGGLGGSVRSLARDYTRAGNKAWLYQFTRVPNTAKARAEGAYHWIETEYIFGNLPEGARGNPADEALSEKISAYVIQFAATGDPNRKGLPEWPACTAEREAQLVWGDEVRPADAPYPQTVTAYVQRETAKRASRKEAPAAAGQR